MAVLLNLLVSVPDPGAPFLFFEVWEIPIFVALLVIGFKGAGVVAGLNTLVLEAVKPGSVPAGPLYNLIAVLSTFVGIMVVRRFAPGGLEGRRRLWVLGTLLGASVRVLVMTVVNWIVLPLPFPLGFGSFGLTASEVPPLLVPIGIFNFILAIYSVPTAFSLYAALRSRSRGSIATTGGAK